MSDNREKCCTMSDNREPYENVQQKRGKYWQFLEAAIRNLIIIIIIRIGEFNREFYNNYFVCNFKSVFSQMA